MNEAQILLLTAASIAFLHTILGPDHYLVFTAMGKARSWSLNKTLRITLFCGLGHVLGSVIIGLVGIILGAQLASVVEIEGIRGNLAGWALLAFGLMYFAWGLKKAGHAVGEVHHLCPGSLRSIKTVIDVPRCPAKLEPRSRGSGHFWPRDAGDDAWVCRIDHYRCG
jgi:sulfite exporter TauE/SafE